MSKPYPAVGSWYQTVEGDILEVVAMDKEEQSIEVQFYDGTVEEYDADAWEELVHGVAEPPEDWAGSFDIGHDDYGVDLDLPAGDSHHNPLDDLEGEEL